MRETDVLYSIFPALSLSAQWVENMAETQQVHAKERSNNESHECPDPGGDLRPQICPLKRWWIWWTS
ncbi:hypothetical protein AB205_0071150 [Aquarana catesbeiana]|uniref:Uncharacterized protein n=1 Tax=Aquarana catesbeiana TaxID=8400 RepID=A0A2G9QJ40_AQUCT|nr:hypothetical protein AB205_0071150 [Aquarana catesbeiana]